MIIDAFAQTSYANHASIKEYKVFDKVHAKFPLKYIKWLVFYYGFIQFTLIV